jgi:hypothetical protein
MRIKIKKHLQNKESELEEADLLRDKRAKNLRRSNCKIDSIDVNQEFKKVGKSQPKPVITTSTTQVCDLVAEAKPGPKPKIPFNPFQQQTQCRPPDPRKICIDKESFDSILRKVDSILHDIPESEIVEEESDRDRKNKVFGDAWGQMLSLSKGIYEKDSKNKKVKYPGCDGNPNHRSKDEPGGRAGTFSSEDDLKSGKKGSASFWYSCRDKLGRVGLKGKKHRWIKEPNKCGRSSDDSPRRKCSDFSENLISENQKRRWKELIEG